MAGSLLFVILMYSFHKIQALLPPKLTVTSSMITETDSVTLSCQPPSYVSARHCFFYAVGQETTKGFSCLLRLTGTELLFMTRQSSPAVVNVKCFYTVKLRDIYPPSPHSDTSSITVNNNVVEVESHAVQTSPTPTASTGLTVDRNHGPTFASTSKQTSGLTVGRHHGLTFASTSKQTPAHQTLPESTKASSFTVTQQLNPAPETWTWTWTWMLVAVTSGGVALGVILLGLGLANLSHKITERCSKKRTKANITGSETRRNQEHQYEGDEIYHVYSTVLEQPPPSARRDMTYHTVQPH